MPLLSDAETDTDPSNVQTKVLPPRGARVLLAREGLLARLLEARRQRCVVIQGPAGSGKTSTLLGWRRELLALNYDVAWLSLSAEDDDLERFCHCLQASLAEVDPALVREAGFLLGRDNGEMALEHWVITLVQSIDRHGRELVLMLDDLHHVQDPHIIQALHWLLDYAPARLHLVLCSRVALPVALARLRGRGQVSDFDLRDLRFSAEESERFLREQLGSIDPRDAAVLHELTDGWVAGLQLFAVDLKAKQGGRFDRVQVRDPGAFASYFEREVLVRLAPEDLRLLTRVSICERFCASLCATLMGQPHAIARMFTQLTRLDSDNLFITQIKSHDQETWYRLHPLLGKVLHSRLAAQADESLASLHATARGWFSSHGHLDEAVRHAVKAGDAEAAADIVEACAYDLLNKGNLSQVSGLLRSLPAEQTASRIGLQLVMAHLSLYARNYPAVEQSLAHLRRQYALLDRNQQHVFTVLQGSLALFRDDTEALLAMRPALLAIPEDADDFAYAGRSNTLAWLYMYQGEFEQARAVLKDGERLQGSPRRSLVGRCFSGMSLALEGRVAQAEHLYREVLEQAQSQGVAYLIVSSMAAALLGVALYEQGDYEAACQLLEPRMKLLQRVALADSVLQAMQTLATAHWLAGRPVEAWSWVERLEQFASSYNLDRLLASALMLRMRWAQQGGDEQQADAVLQRIEQLAAGDQPQGPGTALEVWVIARRAACERYLHKGNLGDAAQQLYELVDTSRAHRRWRRVVPMLLQLAICEQGQQRPQVARELLVEALRQGHRLGLVRTLLDAWPGMAARLQALLEHDKPDPVLEFYTRRLLDIARSTASTQQQAEAGDSPKVLSARELEVLSLVARTLPNKKIARVLNLSPETVKWHMKNIFYKLAVTGRDEAIAKARDLDLKLPDNTAL
ncbi:LuxR C-terminal-related transcriptional regulator [Pseudomonas sp. GD03860]|uniref:LuxR C-terminal-related transcriptional regulator n=1 Tax=Pseudomonas TaxID=286 RepID=UPI00236334EF|nr:MULTISPECIES: LuxR C-terminal-related transcriptional regulator [Pseudomonas]MDD2058657.1 LuxR C-terminal-related transcriptional regulator [Pseudomonas putida]MDH0636890.1 LuxR C-terminal-related transcriptional regulator [Pseudomonas sp. GD03860]